MRVGYFLLAAIAAMFVVSGPLQARVREPVVHGGSDCVNACKEPWRVCFRNVCFSTPGYKNAPGAKRAVIEAEAKTKCAPEWSKFQSCKRQCDKAALRGLSSARDLASIKLNYCPL